MLKITSSELWDTLEVSLLEIKNKYIDEILSLKIEELVNKINSSMANGVAKYNLDTTDKIDFVYLTQFNG